MSQRFINLINAILLFVCLFYANLAAADEFPKPMHLNKTSSTIQPYLHSLVLEDPNNSFEPLDVYQQLINGNGKLPENQVPNLGVTQSAYWFYFEIDNQSTEQNWNLFIQHHLIREVEVYQLENDTWRAKLYSGTSRSWVNRKVDNAYFIYPFETTTNKQVYLLKVFNDDPLIVPISIITKAQLQSTLSFTLWISGLYWGLMIGLILYNSFLYFSTKKNSYLYYVIYTLSFAGYLLTHEAWSYRFAFSNYLWLANNGIHLTIPLLMSCALFFVTKFLKLEKYFPQLNTMMRFLIYWCLFLLITAPWLPSTYHTFLMMFTLQVFAITVILAAIKSWKKGNQDAPFFLLAWGVLIAGALINNLMYFGVVPFNWLTVSASNLGGCIEMLLLSFALASSINRHSKQNKVTQMTHHAMLKDHVLSLAKNNQYKDNFLNTISHELRTPLHGIRASLDLVFEKIKDKKFENEFLLLDSSTIEMERRISDLLVFTDLGSGKFKLNNKPFETYQLIDEIQNKFKALAEDKCLGWQFSIDEHLPRWLIGDKQYLQLVYSQLLDNAIKFTSTGFISTFIDVSSQGTLQVHIRDTGIGFDQKLLEELDKSFVQADAAINRKSGGLGLGLTLCKQLIELMQGTIHFESIIDSGTHVTVTLPAIIPSSHTIPIQSDKISVKTAIENEIVKELDTGVGVGVGAGTGDAIETKNNKQNNQTADQIETAKTKSQQSENQQNGKPLNQLKILIVEDNHVNRMVMGNMIKHLGYDISYAENGQFGVDLCNEQQFALILMDLQMPIMDGITATKIIRQKGLNQQTPIIAVTANAMSSDNEICLAAGMNQHLPKPVRLVELTASIKYWIELSNVH